jgi:hypothetical protein
MRRPILFILLGLFTIAGAASAGQVRPAWGGGVLLKVDTQASTIDVRQGEHVETYTLAPDASFVYEGKKAEGEALTNSIGHFITVRFAADGEARIANRVNVLDRTDAAVVAAAAASAAPATHP